MATRTLAARSPPLHVALGWADKLVEEYLLFRGFVQTHRAFLGEAKHDRLHEFQVDKIVEELLRLLTSFQYHAMMDLWAFLQERFFSRLQHSYWPVVRHLELSLQRFYFVNAIQNDRLDKVRELLESEGERMRSTQDWTQWFQLPFIRDPASDPVFHIYFTKEWASRLVVSVHNLLTTVFHDVPLPALVTQHFNSLQLHMLEHQAKEQEEVREKLQAENLALRNKLRQAETKVARAGHANANAEGLAVAAQSPAQPQIFQEGMMHSGISGTGGDGGAEGDEVPIEVGPAARSGDGSVGRGEGELAMCKVVHEVSFPSHNGPVKRCVFSGAGSTIASASSDATVRVHDLPGTGPANDRSATICCAAPVSSLSWEKRSDRLLLLGSVAGEISVWDVDEKKMALELQSDPAFPRVCDLCASPDGVSLVAACATTQQVLARSLARSRARTLSLNTTAACSRALKKTDAGHVSRQSSSVLQAYSLRAGKLMQTLEAKGDGSIRALHYNHNGSLLAAGTSQGMLQVPFCLRFRYWIDAGVHLAST